MCELEVCGCGCGCVCVCVFFFFFFFFPTPVGGFSFLTSSTAFGPLLVGSSSATSPWLHQLIRCDNLLITYFSLAILASDDVTVRGRVIIQ
jgi:hypothetical protein